MPESGAKIPADTCETIYFFQSETESSIAELDLIEIIPSDLSLPLSLPLPLSQLDSDNDCACE